MEIREICKKDTDNDQKSVSKYRNISKDIMVNVSSGEVVEKRTPVSKAEVKSLTRAMLHNYRLLFYNIGKAMAAGGICYFVTMTNADITSYEEFNKRLELYIKKLKYQNDIRGLSPLKYAFFKEANCDGRYHFHGFVWALDKADILKREEIISKWKFGLSDIKQLTTNEDLRNTLFYVCNYSAKTNSDKVKSKRENLKFFPPGVHLVAKCTGLEEVPFKEVDDDYEIKYSDIFSSSKRSFSNLEYKSIFYLI